MAEFLPLLEQYGALAFVLVLILTGYIYTKPQFVEMRTDRDFYRTKYFSVLGAAEDAVTIAEKLAEKERRS